YPEVVIPVRGYFLKFHTCPGCALPSFGRTRPFGNCVFVFFYTAPIQAIVNRHPRENSLSSLETDRIIRQPHFRYGTVNSNGSPCSDYTFITRIVNGFH